MQLTESRKRRVIAPAVILVTKVKFGRSSHLRNWKYMSACRLEKEAAARRRVYLKIAGSWLLEA